MVLLPHHSVAAHPERPEALSIMFSGTVLVRWRLGPILYPLEVIRISRSDERWGSPGSTAAAVLALSGDREIQLHNWSAPRRYREVDPELLPEDMYRSAVLSPDGRFLVATSCERLHLIDLERNVVVCEPWGFGDWSVEPRFSPDGKILAVGNSMQGSWWLEVLDVADNGMLCRRYAREDYDLPGRRCAEIISDLVFSPGGDTFATWVRPDFGRGLPNGYRGLVVVTLTRTGDRVWQLLVDNDIAGAPGQAESATLAYTPDGTLLAIGLGTGVLWVDAATGAVVGRDHSVGAVNALTMHHVYGILAATNRGLGRLEASASDPEGHGFSGCAGE
ncbi:WD40 repeat domain-containing protein [Nocardia inohanensis]|uniref:WD40 repeat domain-containing protein n=1 Tax=Nocardia inohanensis TaxID=209246 RepID=UPI0012FBDD4F|nr:WD40 repeat domain-containing protein [Nocardia inohanensis]